MAKRMGMDAYLFVHFVGTESTPEEEQIYFSVSEDGVSWHLLHAGRPVLVSDLGERGVRDPFLIRLEDQKRFCLIATDLSIYHRMQKAEEKTAWRQCTSALAQNPSPGSRNMAVWESEDLVHWSPMRLAEAAPVSAGCFWAPKAIWDRERQAYMVVGASKMPEDGYQRLKLYRTYTKDFRSFTEAERYLDLSQGQGKEEGKPVFDCTFAEADGRYFRIYKTDRIQIDTAFSLSGPWETVPSNIHELAPAHEGPAVCKEIKKASWLLMLDNLPTHGGYQPFVTDSLPGGRFTALTGRASFPSGVKYRHGSLLPITREEYERLIKHYGYAEQ